MTEYSHIIALDLWARLLNKKAEEPDIKNPVECNKCNGKECHCEKETTQSDRMWYNISNY